MTKDTTTHDVWQGAREEQHRIRLGTIVDMAAELFNRQGYYATSLSDVADQLKITKAALYYYVKNKEDLIYRCALRAVEELKASLAVAETEGRNGLQKIEILFREILEERRGREAEAGAAFARVVELWGASDPVFQPVVEDARRRLARLPQAVTP